MDVENGRTESKMSLSPGMGLMDLAYNVSLSVNLNTSFRKNAKEIKTKVILKQVVGYASPGSLLAIMGPSGSGKTSLLNCLSQRNSSYTGSVTVNGVQAERGTMARISGFVQQEDLFIPTLTPQEHLRFAAKMRMRGITLDESIQRVETLLTDLGLQKCADTLIGGQDSSIRGISGGEKKRLSLATEILGSPSIIFLDEPTSGLDSFMAEVVVLKLRNLAFAGHTVLCTIHQPNSVIFDLFTHLHLVVEGQTAYFGMREGAIKHFQFLEFPCPPMHNPADHYIRLLSGIQEEGSSEINRSGLDKIISTYPTTDAAKDALAIYAERSSSGQGKNKVLKPEDGVSERRYCASWWTQFFELYKRTLLMYKREPILTRVRLAQAVLVAVTVGLIFLNLGTAQSDVQGINGVIFFAVLNQSVLGTIGVLQVFPLEMPIFLREHGSASYRVDTFFLGRTIAEFPFQVIFPAIYATIIYWMVGFPSDAATFFMFLLYVVLATNAAMSLGYIVSALAKNVSVALALGPLILMPLIIFGGLLINVNDIPPYFQWLSVFSFVYYSYEGCTIVVYEQIGTLTCPSSGQCPYPTAQSVLDYFSFDSSRKWFDVGILVVLIVGFRFVALLALLFRSRSTKSAGY